MRAVSLFSGVGASDLAVAEVFGAEQGEAAGEPAPSAASGGAS